MNHGVLRFSTGLPGVHATSTYLYIIARASKICLFCLFVLCLVFKFSSKICQCFYINIYLWQSLFYSIFLSPFLCCFRPSRRSPAATTQPPVTRVCLPGKQLREMSPYMFDLCQATRYKVILFYIWCTHSTSLFSLFSSSSSPPSLPRSISCLLLVL